MIETSPVAPIAPVNFSLAEHVINAATFFSTHPSFLRDGTALAETAQVLMGESLQKLGAPRFSYDDATAEKVLGHSFKDDPLEFGKISIPFENTWIEGVNFLGGMPDQNNPWIHTRNGFLVQRTSQDPLEFRLSVYVEDVGRKYTPHIDGNVEKALMMTSLGLRLQRVWPFGAAMPPDAKPLLTAEDARVAVLWKGRHLQAYYSSVLVSADKIVVENEDAVLQCMEIDQAHGYDTSYTLDNLYKAAGFVTTLLYLFTNKERVVENNFGCDLTKRQMADAKALFIANSKKLKEGRLPKAPLTPIVYDLAAAERILLSPPPETDKEKEERELLGVTLIRQSKPIVRKDGTWYRRGEHERKIPSDVDRRAVQREITARSPKPYDPVAFPPELYRAPPKKITRQPGG